MSGPMILDPNIGGEDDDGKPQMPITVAGEPGANEHMFLKYQEDLRAWLASRAKIFISCASEDETFYKEVYKFLEGQKFNPWLFSHSIYGGEDWERAIFNAIPESDFFLALVTENYARKASDESGIISREIGAARAKFATMRPDDIFIISIVLGGAELPASLAQFQALPWSGGDEIFRIRASIHEGLSRRDRP